MPKANWSTGIGAGLTGAGTGFAVGGPPGAIVGGIGGLLSGLFGGGKDKQPKIENYPILDPMQQSGLRQYFGNPIERSPLYNQGASYLSSLLSNEPGAFEAYEKPYLQDFQRNIVPEIMNSYMGTGQQAGSSALYNSLAQAAKDLQTNLAAQRANLRGQAANQALGYAQQPYSNLLAGVQVPTMQPYERPGQPGFGTQAMAGAANVFSNALANKGADYLGNKLLGNPNQTPFQEATLSRNVPRTPINY